MTSSEIDSSRRAAWESLVHRSLDAWGSRFHDRRLEKGFIESFTSLEDFLGQPPEIPMFWFFQRRDAFLSQRTMTKWSRDRLADYVLLPATPGYVMRTECFFLSHFWHSPAHPDPEGQNLRLCQAELRVQSWSYIWVDWSCIPQSPRDEVEDKYFTRGLQTMAGIIRNSGFMWYYPATFQPRLWILWETAEYLLTHADGYEVTEDNRPFVEHILEMLRGGGVLPILEKYGYFCTYARDREFLTAWLDALVLFKTVGLSTDDIRRLQDQITWFPSVQVMATNSVCGPVRLERYEGTLIVGGRSYAFTPFPSWVGALI